MKPYFLIPTLLFFVLHTSAQDPISILKQSFEKCQSIENGSFEMTTYHKSMTEKDTTTYSLTCTFKKLKNNKIYSSAFHNRGFIDSHYAWENLYTGEELAYTNLNDSTLTIQSQARWADQIDYFLDEDSYYAPFMSAHSTPLPAKKEYVDGDYIFHYIGEENIKGKVCHHINMVEIAERDPSEMLSAIRVEYNFWIKREDYIPVQYSIAIDMATSNDTMYDYEKKVLTHYDLNNLKDENELTLQSIPSYYKIKDYVPKASIPLPLDTIAPDWSMISLSGKEVDLKDLRGHIVLLDFFYKGCYGCMLAFPELQSLYEKYEATGLRIIGIDPVDKESNELVSFIGRQGITYPVLLDKGEVAKNYRISGYPTVYIIDKEGRIIFVKSGYNKTVEAAIDEVIQKNL